MPTQFQNSLQTRRTVALVVKTRNTLEAEADCGSQISLKQPTAISRLMTWFLF
jgi:hypothetical protein